MKEQKGTLEKIEGAKDYFDVFGPCPEGVEPKEHVKRTYRRLALVAHPDRYSTSSAKERAQEAFKDLGDYLEAAKRAVSSGKYGVVPRLVIRSRRTEYEVGDILFRGEIADLYSATNVSKPDSKLVMKIVRKPIDNDLLSREAAALRTLRSSDGDSDMFPYFPELLDTFIYKDEESTHRRVNVFNELEGWYNLEEVRSAYRAGVSPLDMAWIWRRVLWLLGYAHQQGILHTAVLPSHIMVMPEMHGIMLLDWCYSQTRDPSDSFQSVGVVSSSYKGWYPKEVTEKQVPSHGTDIYLAAQSMVYALGGENVESLNAQVPRAFKAFFRGCMQENHRVRPQDAWSLLAEFDELLERLGKPYFPRKFHPFSVDKLDR